jgi:hypothetical protein
MLEFRPALQLTVRETKPILYDMLAGQSLELGSDDDLMLLGNIAGLLPCEAEELGLRLVLRAKVTLARAREFISLLCRRGILCESGAIAAEKAAVQNWVDHGWMDALVLHLSSRNLRYADDAVEFGGKGRPLCSSVIASEVVQCLPTPGADVSRLRRPADDVPSESILDAISRRRSFKPFTNKKMESGQIDDVLWYANTRHRERSLCLQSQKDVFDSSFSCISTFIIAYCEIPGEVALSPGAYLYRVQDHSLETIRQGDFRREVQGIASGQKRASSGLFSIVLVADWAAYAKIYRHERSYRNLLINVGELAQYYLIWLTLKGFNTFMSPAISDEKMMQFLRVDHKQPIYLICAG